MNVTGSPWLVALTELIVIQDSLLTAAHWQPLCVVKSIEPVVAAAALLRLDETSE